MNVDFSLLKKHAISKNKTVVATWAGPISQSNFLVKLGIMERLRQLEELNVGHVDGSLRSGVERLVGREKNAMGESYLVSCLMVERKSNEKTAQSQCYPFI